MPVENLIDSSEICDRENSIVLQECPTSWDELRSWFRQAQHNQQKLAIAYTLPPPVPPLQIWEQLIGIAKYLSRTSKPVTRQQLGQKLGISDTSLQLGLKTLTHLGFKVNDRDRAFHITRQPETENIGKTISKPLLDSQSTQFSASNSPQLAHSAQIFLSSTPVHHSIHRQRDFFPRRFYSNSLLISNLLASELFISLFSNSVLSASSVV